jgi:cytochrome c-type biogenesis protein CcmH
MRRAALALVLILAVSPALAVEPDEMLADPALEARAQALGRELRCLVCQSESIDGSNAAIARELRLVVRERLAAGDSDQAVRDFLVARYGEFVLLRPPVRGANWVLWLAGPALLLAGVAVAAAAFRRRGAAPEAALTPEEEARLAALLKDPRA